MKKFEFRLAALKKVREGIEKKVKLELGNILSDIQKLKDENDQFEKDIAQAYDDQTKALEANVDPQFLRFYPYYIEGRKQKIENNKNAIFSLQKKFEDKREELVKAQADVKVINGLEDKEREKYNREYNKKLQDILDESSIRKEYMKRLENTEKE